MKCYSSVLPTLYIKLDLCFPPGHLPLRTKVVRIASGIPWVQKRAGHRVSHWTDSGSHQGRKKNARSGVEVARIPVLRGFQMSSCVDSPLRMDATGVRLGAGGVDQFYNYVPLPGLGPSNTFQQVMFGHP